MLSTAWIFFFLFVYTIIGSCRSHEHSYTEVEPCSIERCQLPYCYCSSQSIPGDLSVRDTPQFIAINVNGPLEKRIFDFLEDIFFSQKYSNPDGCPISGTIFLKSHAETDYDLLRQMLDLGNIELALTSVSNECPTVDCRVKEKNDTSPFVSWRSYRFYDEIVKYRRSLQKLTGVRASSIVGYRSPNYEVNNKQLHWQILREHRFLYDSTLITQEWASASSRQQQSAPLTWPHTMDFAANYDCSQGCYTHSFPGLWNIPIHMYQDFDGRNCTTIGSSHCRVPRSSERFFEYLKYNLNRHLHSNHAPFIMSFDSYWINEPYTDWRMEGLKMFLNHTLRHHPNNVYLVRLIDIINWIKQPGGLKKMKLGHLSSIGFRSSCEEQQTTLRNRLKSDSTELFNRTNNGTPTARNLLILFDAVSEPLFRSNIVYYSTIAFILLILFTMIYDRFFSS